VEWLPAKAWRRLRIMKTMRWRLLAGLAPALLWTTIVTANAAARVECLPTAPIGCSVGWAGLIRVVTAVSIIFEDACLTHDLCYRHGEATYGYDKATCDDTLLDDLEAICGRDPTFLTYVTLGLSKLLCHLAKRGVYAAVSQSEIAAAAFRTGSASTCCRYDEAGDPLPECSA
jgi:hypothetical protein